MLDIISSNRLEPLVAQLAAAISGATEDPFATTQVVISTPSIARWLSVELAKHQGICANIEFILPARFLWEQIESLPEANDSAALQKVNIIWHCLSVIEQLQAGELEPLQHYLQQVKTGDTHSAPIIDLSRTLADVFDQYLVYRGDWLLEWETQPTAQHWQAELWHRITDRLDGPHRAQLQQKLITALKTNEIKPQAKDKPVFFFNPQNLAPEQWQIIQCLADHCDLIIFSLNPTLHFWDDISAERRSLRQKAQAQRQNKSDPTIYHELGHPLLSAFGEQGQRLRRQLQSLSVNEYPNFIDIPRAHLLGHIQADITDMSVTPISSVPAEPHITDTDRSVQIHSCHSPLRELQILHDQLHTLFDADPELEPSDIVVMCPDITAYAAAIEAVFGGAPQERQIPWSLNERPSSDTLSITQVLERLLVLPDSRLTVDDVFSMLALPALQKRFELDDQKVAKLHPLMIDAGAHWSSTDSMMREQGNTKDLRFSWSYAFQRLFFGHMVASDTTLVANTAPFGDLEGGSILDVSALQSLIDKLDQWRQALKQNRTAEHWLETIHQLINDFFIASDAELQQVDALINTAAHLAQQAVNAKAESICLDYQGYRQLFSNEAQLRQSGQVFHDGRLSFCSMLPLRSVPFKVVCLIGLNHGSYPKAHRSSEFDLIAQFPREGDRQHRLDDRYLFLEAILSARSVLYCSYCGHNLRDNSELMPSVILSEFIDIMQRHYDIKNLITKHALHPFSEENFTTNSDYQSYANEWMPPRIPPENTEIDTEQVQQSVTTSCTDINLTELIRFLNKPLSYYAKNTLNISLPYTDQISENHEPQEIDGLRRYQAAQVIVENKLNNTPSQKTIDYIKASGLQPYGQYGHWQIETLNQHLNPLQQSLDETLPTPSNLLDIDVSLPPYRIRGRITLTSLNQLVHWRTGDWRTKDQLSLFIESLAVQLQLGHQITAIGLSQALDKSSTASKQWAPPLRDQEEAKGYLLQLCKCYHAGQEKPFLFAPETAMEILKGNESKAKTNWHGAPFLTQGEHQDQSWQLLFPDFNPFSDDCFINNASLILSPLLDNKDKKS